MDPMLELRDPRPLLRSGAVLDRLEGIDAVVAQGGPIELLIPLLQDDAPYLYERAGRRWIAEVSAYALDAWAELAARVGPLPALGPVRVRKAMDAGRALDAARERLAGLTADRRRELEEQARRRLEERVQPWPEEEAVCRAYITLQLLGEVSYEWQRPDPVTGLTPLQPEIHRSQMVSPRPRPHLRFDGPDGPVGYVYRAGGRWLEDFGESPLVPRIRSLLRSFRNSEGGELPRVAGALEGRPRHAPGGGFVLEGVVPRDVADPLEYLASLHALMVEIVPCTLVP